MTEEQSVTFPKPRITLLDMPVSTYRAVSDAGYNVELGTFGEPGKVKTSGDVHYVPTETVRLPNFDEQEIVLMNLVYPSSYRSLRITPPGTGVTAFWQSGTSGLIDPRPLTMTFNSDRARRILDHGGVFIVILDQEKTVEYVRGSLDRFEHLDIEARHTFSNWSLLSEFNGLESKQITGTEVRIQEPDSVLGGILRSVQDSVEYRCAFEALGSVRTKTREILHNKYNQCVGAHIAEVGANEQGHVLLLPPMTRFDEIVVDIIGKWAIEAAPSLFPYHETTHWIHQRDYELPEVLRIQGQIQETREQAERTIRDLEQQIEAERIKNEAWYRLLDGTGDHLASAVIDIFREFGFWQVEDVDAKPEADTESDGKREDIQILDFSPVLIVEVKGIGGKPSDPECSQADKHAMMRMREWNRTDVQALTIINHERHLPPHQREREPFRTEIVGNAQQSNSGLMTTWDLFCLLRNARDLNWPLDAVRSVFYRTGRIRPIPEHYKKVAEVVKTWTHAVGIIPETEIARGDVVAIEHGTSFIEIEIESLHVNDSNVEMVRQGDECGIKLPAECTQVRKKSRVFKVIQNPDSEVGE